MTRAGVAHGWGQGRAGMAALVVCMHTEPLLQPLERVPGATVCPLVTSEGLRLLEESILLPSCNQGRVSSPSHVPRGLGLPRGAAVSNVHQGDLCAPEALRRCLGVTHPWAEYGWGGGL